MHAQKNCIHIRKSGSPSVNSADNQCWPTHGHNQAPTLTGVDREAGGVEFAHVKLHSDDGKHDNSEEEQQADLKQRNHGFHDGLQHHLEAWEMKKDREDL